MIFGFLFKRYNLLIFKKSGEIFVNFYVRGFLFPLFILLTISLIAGNVWLFKYYVSYKETQYKLTTAEELKTVQHNEIEARGFKVLSYEDEIKNIVDFNYKMRIMLGLEDAPYHDYTKADSENEDTASDQEPEEKIVYISHLDRTRNANKKFKEMFRNMRVEEVYQQDIKKEIISQKENLTKIPSIWPTRGRFASKFGYRRSPFTGRSQFHKGIDIATPRGSNIIAPASGTVTFVDWFSTYGRTVEISHGMGLKTRYAHMNKFAVKVGDKVDRGQLIGYVGNTGRSMAPHLHYEVHKRGKLMNPMYYIMEN